MKQERIVHFFLRLSISSVFFYAAIAATVQPGNWIGFIPQVFYHFLPPDALLKLFSVFQFLLALWIITGWKAFYSGLFAAVTLIAIISANWGDLDILFRDFAIFFAAVALSVASYTHKKKL